MNKLILAIILILLLSPSIVSAKEKQEPLSDDAIITRFTTPYNIGKDMFMDVYEEYGYQYRLFSIFNAFGYENLAKEVLKDTPVLAVQVDLFHKHEKKYKYDIAPEEMFTISVQILEGLISGYTIGYKYALKMWVVEKDMGLTSDIVPKMYEEYLEGKKRKQLKQKDGSIDRKGDR